MGRTLKQRHSAEGIVKPGELIDIRQSAALTLHDRRVLNLLIERAGPDIASDQQHRISMVRLRGTAHRGGERVRDSIERLMKTLILIPTRDSNGNKATTRVQLLASTTTTDDEENPSGEVTYTFHKEVRDIIARSEYWGRIKASVMFAFSSKYALALYEAICLRQNLKHDSQFFKPDDFRELLGVDRDLLTRFPDIIARSEYWGRIKASVMFAFSSKYALALYEAICLRQNLKHDSQFFKPDDFRELLGVDRDLLTRFPDFKRRVLDPALTEVNALSDCNVEVEIQREAGSRSAVMGYRLRWSKKTSEEWQAVMDELLRPKVGRKARIEGKVENLAISEFGWDTGPQLISSRG